MGLHPMANKYLESIAMHPAKELSIETMKEDREQFILTMAPPLNERPVIHQVEDRTIPGPAAEIPIRVYSPVGDGPFPVLVFFHGGGWIRGGIETTDVLCRRIAQMGQKVVSVEYRLAPENPYPAAADDCYCATLWVAEHIKELSGDITRISIGGESAGGNLAAAVSMMVRDRKGPTLSKQILIYPVTECWEEGQQMYDSANENASGYGLSKDRMHIYWKFYVPQTINQFHPYVAPIREQNLFGLPQALIITAEYDVLRDEGEAYGQRLKDAGVPVRMKRYEGMIHGFLSLFDSSPTDEAYRLIGEYLNE